MVTKFGGPGLNCIELRAKKLPQVSNMMLTRPHVHCSHYFTQKTPQLCIQLTTLWFMDVGIELNVVTKFGGPGLNCVELRAKKLPQVSNMMLTRPHVHCSHYFTQKTPQLCIQLTTLWSMDVGIELNVVTKFGGPGLNCVELRAKKLPQVSNMILIRPHVHCSHYFAQKTPQLCIQLTTLWFMDVGIELNVVTKFGGPGLNCVELRAKKLPQVSNMILTRPHVHCSHYFTQKTPQLCIQLTTLWFMDVGIELNVVTKFGGPGLNCIELRAKKLPQVSNMMLTRPHVHCSHYFTQKTPQLCIQLTTLWFMDVGFELNVVTKFGGPGLNCVELRAKKLSQVSNNI